MNLSIIIPVFNESESLIILSDEIHSVMLDLQHSYEIIFIDDGSTDESWRILQSLSVHESTKSIRFKKNIGKSSALDVGFFYAQGEVVITMDSDLQDDPREIPALYNMIKLDGYDLVFLLMELLE